MIHTEIGFEKGQIAEVFELLAGVKNGANLAMTRSLNRTAIGARKEIVQAIRQKHEVHARDLKDVIKIKKANFDNLEAQVHSFGAVIPLDEFKHSPRGFQLPRPKIGVRVKVRKDRPGGRIPGTFFIPNNPHIFRRENDDPHGKLIKLFGPAVPSMMRVVLDEDDEQRIQDRAEERMLRELAHEVDFFLTKGKE